MNEVEKYLRKKDDQFEAVCQRCGACCGAFDGDSCLHLKKGRDGRYYCNTYETRLGKQTTVTGKSFECVPIKDVLRYSYTREQKCAYLEKGKPASG